MRACWARLRLSYRLPWKYDFSTEISKLGPFETYFLRVELSERDRVRCSEGAFGSAARSCICLQLCVNLFLILQGECPSRVSFVMSHVEIYPLFKAVCYLHSPLGPGGRRML